MGKLGGKTCMNLIYLTQPSSKKEEKVFDNFPEKSDFLYESS